MKKILSFLAAGALALGLIGCSADLHDALKTDVSTLQIRGDLPGASWDGTDLKKDTEDTYSFSFLATTSTGHFAFTEKDNGWNVAYRGTSDGKLYKGFETSFDEAVLYDAPKLPDCIPVALTVGASYKITVTGGSATVNCKIVQTAEAIPMAIVINGEESDVTPTGAAKYKYEFEPSNEERTVKFSFKSGIAVFAPAAETALTVGNSSSASVSSAAAATWSIKLEKDTPYQLAISYADGKVSVTFLTNYSCLLANWLVEGWGRSSFEKPEYRWTESLSGITLSAKTYDEATKIATYEARWVVSNASTIGADIALHRGPNDWDDGGRYELGDNKELKVGTKYKLEKGKDPGNGRAYVLLGEGNNVIVATYESYDTTGDVYVTYSVEKEVIPPTIPDLSTWNLKGNMNDDSWSTPYFTFTKIKENTFTAVFEWTRDTTGTLEFGLIDANGDWKGGCGVELSSAKATADGSVLSGGNSHITGLEKGKTYSITISVKDVDGNASFAFATLK